MVSKEKKEKEEQYQLLNQLREMAKLSEGQYIEETLELIQPFHVELTDCINAIIDRGLATEEMKERANRLLSKGEDMQKRLDAARVEWGKLKEEIEEVVEFGVAFIQGSNFYPPEYTFNINKLKGSTIEIDEHVQDNPLHDSNGYKELIVQVKTEIHEYRALHEETTELIEKIKKRKVQFGKEEKAEMLEIKEKLFRNLQMGQLGEVKKELKKLRKELKRM